MDGFNRRFQNPGIAKKGGEGRGLVSQFLQCQACYFVLCYTQEEYTPTPSSLGDIIDYHRPYPSLPNITKSSSRSLFVSSLEQLHDSGYR